MKQKTVIIKGKKKRNKKKTKEVNTNTSEENLWNDFNTAYLPPNRTIIIPKENVDQ